MKEQLTNEIRDKVAEILEAETDLHDHGLTHVDAAAHVDVPVDQHMDTAHADVHVDLNPHELVQSMAAFHVDDVDVDPGPGMDVHMVDVSHVIWDETPTDDVNS